MCAIPTIPDDSRSLSVCTILELLPDFSAFCCLESMRKVFQLPPAVAAVKLGLKDASHLKTVARSFGIKRWPSTRLAALRRLKKTAESQNRADDVQRLSTEMKSILDDPNHQVQDETVKQYLRALRAHENPPRAVSATEVLRIAPSVSLPPENHSYARNTYAYPGMALCSISSELHFLEPDLAETEGDVSASISSGQTKPVVAMPDPFTLACEPDSPAPNLTTNHTGNLLKTAPAMFQSVLMKDMFDMYSPREASSTPASYVDTSILRCIDSQWAELPLSGAMQVHSEGVVSCPPVMDCDFLLGSLAVGNTSRQLRSGFQPVTESVLPHSACDGVSRSCLGSGPGTARWSQVAISPVSQHALSTACNLDS